jgi:hypothetical protein
MEMPIKWVDNLLSQHELPGVERSRQGIERRISDSGLLAIELVRVLSREAGMTVADAVRIARQVLAVPRGRDVSLALAIGVELRIHATTLEERLRQRLADAIDAAPRVRRGRPVLDPEKRTPDA